MKGGIRRVLTFRDANSYPCTAGFKDRNFQKWDHCIWYSSSIKSVQMMILC